MATLFGYRSKTPQTGEFDIATAKALKEIESSVNFIFDCVVGIQSDQPLRQSILKMVQADAKNYVMLADDTDKMRWLNTHIKSAIKKVLGITDLDIIENDINENAPTKYQKFYKIEDVLDRTDWFSRRFNDQLGSAAPKVHTPRQRI